MAIHTYQFLGSGRQGFVTIPSPSSEQSGGSQSMDPNTNQQQQPIDPRPLQDSISQDEMPSNTSPEEASSSQPTQPIDNPSLQEQQQERTKFSWFGSLPEEVRVLILEYVFSDEQFEAQLDEGRFHSMNVELKEANRIDGSPNNLVNTHAVILRLPSFRTLFVSRAFLTEALPVYARTSYTYLKSLMAPEALGSRIIPPPSLQGRTLLDTFTQSRNLVIRTDDWQAWYHHGAQVLTWFFPALRRIDIVAPEGLALARGVPLHNHTHHGHFTHKPASAALRRQMPAKHMLNPLEVQQLLSHTVLPPSLLASLQCNLAIRNLDPTMQTPRHRTIRFREAAFLAWMLTTIGWEGTLFYHVEFDCRMDVQSEDGPVAAKLKLKLDLSRNRLVKAVFTV